MQRLAEQFGKADTFHLTPVGVFFGRDGEPGARAGRSPDPFFGGAGPGPHRLHPVRRVHDRLPARRQEHARPTNYLALAERAGAEVHPLTTVTGVRPLPGGGYAVDTAAHRHGGSATVGRTFTADQVVFSAGTYNTQKLLHQLRGEHAAAASRARLGELTRTNSEALLGVRTPKPQSTTTPRAWRSPRRGTPTRTPTSSRCATARAATRWACSTRC